MIVLRSLDEGRLRVLEGVEAVEAALDGLRGLAWLDFVDPTEHELHLLEERLGFHPLSIEDVIHARQRPKVEEYEDYFFLTVHEVNCHPGAAEAEESLNAEPPSASLRPRSLRVVSRQVSVFVRDSLLVTVHDRESQTLRQVAAACANRPSSLSRGADYLLYLLLDTMVDRYFPIIEMFDEQIDRCERRALSHSTRRNVLEDLFALRRALIYLRKVVAPTRNAIGTLLTRTFPAIQTETLPYLRDVNDHLIRIHEILETQRDLLAGAMEAHLSTVNNQMNLIIQRLTIVTVIFLPLTFLTGFFGMNLRVSPWQPEWDNGQMFWVLLGLMLAASGSMAWWFYRKRLL